MARVRRGADRAATCSTIRMTAARPVQLPRAGRPDADLDVISAERGELRLDLGDGLVEFGLGHADPGAAAAQPSSLAWISLIAASTAAGSRPMPIARSRIPPASTRHRDPAVEPVWSRPTATYADAIRNPRPSSSATGITSRRAAGVATGVRGLGRSSGGLARHRRSRGDRREVGGRRDGQAARGLEPGPDVVVGGGRPGGRKGPPPEYQVVVLGFGVSNGDPAALRPGTPASSQRG